MKFSTVLAALAATASAKEAIDNGLYQKIIYYAQLSGAALEATPCYSTANAPPYGIAIQKQLDTPFNGTDVHATIFRNDTKSEFVVAFAASNNTVNFLEDLDTFLVESNGNFPCEDCLFHRGFQTAYGRNNDPSALAGKVRTALAAAVLKYPSYTITITGASLGGALASLSFSDLVQIYRTKITGIYTYGQPRIGNRDYAAYVNTNAGDATLTNPGIYYRVTHSNDFVVKLPPPGASGPRQYRHSLTEYWESKIVGDDNTATTTYRCVGSDDGTCTFGTPPDFASGVAAHMDYAGFKAVECTNRPKLRFEPR